MTDPLYFLDYFKRSMPASEDLLRTLVETESNSLDKSGIDSLGSMIAARLAAPRVSIRILEESNAGNHLLVQWRSGSSLGPVLLLGHLDTVWPRGTLKGRPFSIKNGYATGPGVFDMKAGVLLYLLVFQALGDHLFAPRRDILIFLTSDEETGTSTGLGPLRNIAKPCAAVLCAEPPLPGGKAKTSRSGVGTFRLRVSGAPAHAGVDHASGASAIQELSTTVTRLHALTDYERGVLVNVGVIRGGSASNVVAADAEAEVDFRFRTRIEGIKIAEEIRNLKSCDPRCSLTWEGGVNRPPLERTPQVVALYEIARKLGSSLGMDLGEGSTGGGSDASFTADMGIPSLDGLGVAGHGAHALEECVEMADIPRRAALLCSLIENIGE